MRYLQMGSSWSEQSRRDDRARRQRRRAASQRRRRAWVEHPVKQAWRKWGPLG